MNKVDLNLVWGKNCDPFLDIYADGLMTSIFLTEAEGDALLKFFEDPQKYFENAGIPDAEYGFEVQDLSVWVEPDEDQDSGFNVLIDFSKTRIFIYNASVANLQSVARSCISLCEQNHPGYLDEVRKNPRIVPVYNL